MHSIGISDRSALAAKLLRTWAAMRTKDNISAAQATIIHVAAPHA
jgi:hypothetical protein